MADLPTSAANFLQKQASLKALFAPLRSFEEVYHKIIDLGREQKPLEPLYKREECLVRGCQSRLYLRSYEKEGFIYFETEADALISAGLAQLLTRVYSGETLDVILTHAPIYLHEIGLLEGLSPSRSNGLFSLHLKMKQDALKLLSV